MQKFSLKIWQSYHMLEYVGQVYFFVFLKLGVSIDVKFLILYKRNDNTD